MTLSERGRDFLVVGVFLALIGGLVIVGWADRDTGPSLATGEPAPDVRLPRIDGRVADLAALQGRPVIVNIWATWCAPCVREMPALQRVYERYRDEGLEVVAVAVDDVPGQRQEDGRIVGKVSEFVREYGLTFPVAVDPTGETERRFGTEYLPTTVLIDRTGRIRLKEIGARAWDEPPFLDLIDALIEEG